MAKYFERTWSDEEIARLRMIWNTPLKVVNFGEVFPDRDPQSVYSYGRKSLKLGHRRVDQDFDQFLSWKRIYGQLELGPKTARQLSICTGMDLSKILEMLRKRKQKTVRVCDWTTPGRGGRQQVWGIGSDPDAPQPPKLSKADIARRYREKVRREEPERAEVWTKKKKIREKVKTSGFARRDPAASWF